MINPEGQCHLSVRSNLAFNLACATLHISQHLRCRKICWEPWTSIKDLTDEVFRWCLPLPIRFNLDFDLNRACIVLVKLYCVYERTEDCLAN